MLNEGDFDLVVVTGDLTRFGKVPEFKAAAAWLATIKAPKLVTPGNHDAPYFAWSERIFAPFRRYEHAIGSAPAQMHLGGGFAVRGLNTTCAARSRASTGRKVRSPGVRWSAAIDWFERSPAECVRIVACHHPLTEMIGGPMTARVWGGAQAARDFAQAGVDLVLSGHIHVPFAWPYPFGDQKTYAVGAGTLSTRERGVPPSFNVMDIDGAAIRIAALVWTGRPTSSPIVPGPWIAARAARGWSLDHAQSS